MLNRAATKQLQDQFKDIKSRQEALSVYWGDGESIPCLNFFTKFMGRMLNAGQCRLVVQNPRDRNTWLKAGDGVECGEIGQLEKDSAIDVVIQSGEVRREEGLLCIPILGLHSKKTVGAVEVVNKGSGGEFTADDLETLTEMAHYLQMSIENIFLNREMCDVSEDMMSSVSRLTSIISVTLFSVIGVALLYLIMISIAPSILN